MPKGTISQFEEKAGYGLIQQEDGSVVRFHVCALVTLILDPGVGDHVTYDIGGDENGPGATDITVHTFGLVRWKGRWFPPSM